MLRYILSMYCVLAMLKFGADGQDWTTMGGVVSTLGDDTVGKTEIRPLNDASNTLQVYLDLNVAAIIGFDEANGFIELSGYLRMKWTAESYHTEPNIGHVMIENTNLWRPPIIVVNAIQAVEITKSNTDARIRYSFTDGECIWEPWIIVKAACTPDVKYYPFDKQTCKLSFASWGYTSSEVLLTPANAELQTRFFEENGEWEITDTSAAAREDGDISLVDFEIKLTRRPLYYIINLLCPIVVLGMLNVFVFWLPAESGERVGFAVTCFLAYVVLLNTVMGFLPSSAAPLSYLSYYTFIMMMFSAGMSLATIFSLRVHRKAENNEAPPRWLAVMCNCFRCQCSWICDQVILTPRKTAPRNLPRASTSRETKNNREEATPVESIRSTDMGFWDDDKYVIEEDDTDNENKDETTWKTIAEITDITLFLGFLAAQIFYSAAYLLPMYFASQ